MADGKIAIKIKVLDHWIEDKVDRGSNPMKLFCLMKFGNKIYLVERELEDN